MENTDTMTSGQDSQFSAEKEIIKVIEKIRPYINRDGGDIEFVDFQDGIVYVKMLGACNGCSLIDSTLQDGVAEILMEEVPGVYGVQDVNQFSFF